MTKNKTTSLSEALGLFAPQGANDARWVFVEHQLEQVKISAKNALSTLLEITNNPENESERKTADDCYLIVRSMSVAIFKEHATFLSYLSDTSVSERISRKEL